MACRLAWTQRYHQHFHRWAESDTNGGNRRGEHSPKSSPLCCSSKFKRVVGLSKRIVCSGEISIALLLHSQGKTYKQGNFWINEHFLYTFGSKSPYISITIWTMLWNSLYFTPVTGILIMTFQKQQTAELYTLKEWQENQLFKSIQTKGTHASTPQLQNHSKLFPEEIYKFMEKRSFSTTMRTNMSFVNYLLSLLLQETRESLQQHQYLTPLPVFHLFFSSCALKFAAPYSWAHGKDMTILSTYNQSCKTLVSF